MLIWNIKISSKQTCATVSLMLGILSFYTSMSYNLTVRCLELKDNSYQLTLECLKLCGTNSTQSYLILLMSNVCVVDVVEEGGALWSIKAGGS